jgi:hypothetical protein
VRLEGGIQFSLGGRCRRQREGKDLHLNFGISRQRIVGDVKARKTL